MTFVAPEIRIHDGQGQIKCPVCNGWRLELIATIPAPQPPPAIVEASKLKDHQNIASGHLSGVCVGCFVRAAAGLVAAAPTREQIEAGGKEEPN